MNQTTVHLYCTTEPQGTDWQFALGNYYYIIMSHNMLCLCGETHWFDSKDMRSKPSREPPENLLGRSDVWNLALYCRDTNRWKLKSSVRAAVCIHTQTYVVLKECFIVFLKFSDVWSLNVASVQVHFSPSFGDNSGTLNNKEKTNNEWRKSYWTKFWHWTPNVCWSILFL